MAKEQKQPTFIEDIESLLKDKKIAMQDTNIVSSTDFFNDLNDVIRAHLFDHAERIENETERNDFVATITRHFAEIKQLRELYDKLKK